MTTTPPTTEVNGTMRAVVLVGGRGSRLRPLTDSVPKPMLPIGHRPMIVRLVDQLGRAGIDEVVLALGFRPEPFRDAFPDGRCGAVRLVYAVEPEPLDTAGAIGFAARAAGIDDTFVVANGDVVTDLDISALIESHRARAADATIHLIPVADPSEFGVVETDTDGRVRRFVEKPAPGESDSNLINAGTYVFEPSVLDRIPAGRRVSVERETFQQLVADGTLYACATEDYWTDTGRPDLYRDANLAFLDGRRAERCDPVAAGAVVDSTACIDRSVVESGAQVAAGAALIDSVVLTGAVIGRDAQVERSIIMGRVGQGASVIDSVIGADGTVESGERLQDRRLPEPD